MEILASSHDDSIAIQRRVLRFYDQNQTQTIYITHVTGAGYYVSDNEMTDINYKQWQWQKFGYPSLFDALFGIQTKGFRLHPPYFYEAVMPNKYFNLAYESQAHEMHMRKMLKRTWINEPEFAKNNDDPDTVDLADYLEIDSGAGP